MGAEEADASCSLENLECQEEMEGPDLFEGLR
jgi:hypothetical protein